MCVLGMQEDGPEAALAKLLASAGGEQGPFAGLASRNPPLRGVPLEQQLQVSCLLVHQLCICLPLCYSHCYQLVVELFVLVVV